MTSLWKVVTVSLVLGAWSHGFLTMPVARQQGRSSLKEAGTVCGYCSCCWYQNKVAIPGKPTMCDKEFLTAGVSKPCSGSDWTRTKPWRSPGTAPIGSPCGMNGGKDGASLPVVDRTVWKQGSVVEIAMAITANHGGGYVYRLCPADSKLTEECFRANTLPFANNVTTVHYINGSTATIAAKRTSVGTFPAGSEWSMNPIPNEVSKFTPPLPGLVGSHWAFSLIDQIQLPKELTPGNYVLSWRWDCEITPQVWTNCGDVTITDGPVPSPTPAPPSPTPAPPSPTPSPPAPPSPAPAPPSPTPPAPAPTPKHPTCCWSKWGGSSSCGDYVGPGARCNTVPSKSCSSDSDCKGLYTLI